MRMRKLKWAKEYIEESNLTCDPSKLKGKWHRHLNAEKLHVEIGTGKGDYFIGMSQLYPQDGWIGVEKNESVAALALRKADEEQVSSSVSFIYGDATYIDEWFEQGELDVIHLNFSDPWPKNRTSKRRLSHDKFLSKYYDLLKDSGEIQMKTDNRLLFEYSLLSMDNNRFKLVDVSLDFRSEEHAEDIISEYEKKFMDKGNPIYRGVFKKRMEELK